MDKKKKKLLLCYVVGILVVNVGILVIFVPIISRDNFNEQKLEAWNIYNGELAAYTVEINETKKDGVWRRLVHLEPINGYEKPHPNPFAITGHDYDGDYCFDRVFIRPSLTNGYNSVYFTRRGERLWEPCPADKEKLSPFIDRQVASAQSQLYLAMATTHNEAHLVSTLEDWQKNNN